MYMLAPWSIAGAWTSGSRVVGGVVTSPLSEPLASWGRVCYVTLRRSI